MRSAVTEEEYAKTTSGEACKTSGGEVRMAPAKVKRADSEATTSMFTAFKALGSVADAYFSKRRMNIAEAAAAAKLRPSPMFGGSPLAPSPATSNVPKKAAAAESHADRCTCCPNRNCAKKGTSFTFRYSSNTLRCAVV